MTPGEVLTQIVLGVRTLSPSGFTLESPTTTEADGLRTTRTAAVFSGDPAIRMGSWELRLIPTVAGVDPTPRVPVELVETLAGEFQSVALELGRLELVCDRTVFIPGSLVSEPFQHIVAVSDPNARVRLFGPGLRVRFAGADFSDVSVEVTGAEGSSNALLPSLRFDPPHFLVGGDTVGIACDEAMLDLRDDTSPPNVPVAPGSDANAWTGLFLKELGVFISNGSQPGSGDWAGNAVLRNFFIGFDPVELSGTFRAELIHLVADVDPQVVIAVTHPKVGGGVDTTSDADVQVPEPPAGSTSQLVRIEATANWDSQPVASGSLRARWTVPASAQVEDGYRVERMNLGAVRLPPGDHTFTLTVQDDRLPEGQREQTATRTIRVAGVAVTGPTAQPLRLTADAMRVLADGNSPRQRIHVGVAPGAAVTVSAVARGGSGAVDFQLTLPAGWSTSSPNPSAVARDAHGAASATWSVTAGSSAGDDALVVTATAAGSTATHRVRTRVEADAAAAAPDFRLSSYTDARPDAGVVQALVELHHGARYEDLAWTLEARSADADLFASAAHDGLFAPASAGWAPTGLLPTLSAGAVRAYLPESKLYRLTGRRGGSSTPRPPVVISGRALRGDELGSVRATDPDLVGTSSAPAAGGADFLFPYDATTIQPGTIGRQGPEHTSLRKTAAEIASAQVAALAALYRAVLEDPAAVVAIHVFGQASVEGSDAYNLDLAERRATAAEAQIVGSGPLPTAAAAAAGTTLAAVQAALAGKPRQVHTFGESHSHTVYVPATGGQSVDPGDRRVFFVVERSSAAAGEIVREEFFVVRADAEVVPTPIRPPSRPLQKHPFRHNCFRKATTEIELLRNRVMKFQVVLVVDLEAFNENDADPRELNNADGITTFFLEYKEDPAPAAGEPRFSWELAALADPRDADGLVAATSATVRQVLGGPLITVPAITAISGGEIGAGAFIAAATVGGILSGLELITIDFLCLSGVRMRVRYGNDAGTELRFGVDYKLKYRITVDLQERYGIPVQLVTEQPIEIGFRNVGVEIREGRDVRFFYKPDEGFALDVRDPGVFQLGEGIGRLLRVDRVRLGAGSPLWFEVELGFAFDTGIFSVDTLRIRVSFDSDQLFPTSGDVSFDDGTFSMGDFALSINKLGVSVDVPGVLSGSGSLEMTNDAGTFTIAGAAEVDVVPLKFGVSAGAKFVQRDVPTPLTAFFGSLGVEFSPGLPLGTTGIALQGLEGLLGVNMGRSMPGPQEALAWYMQDPIGATHPDKWVADEGRWAVGAGAVLGTVYDAGFTFNLKGLFLLELPGPKFTLAANANLIKVPPALSDESEQGTIAALVMLDFENDVFLIGLDFRYTIPHVLDLHVPVEAFFNLRNARQWHIRFGQWEPASKRISLKVLNLWTASGYVQIEGDRLQNSKLNLIGPAVGLGARVEINWGARPVVWFEAFLEWHVGVQFKPLLVMGSIEVGGSLHLGPFSIGGRGLLTVRAPDPLHIHGEVCGEIDLWLFSIKGCAKLSIGGGGDAVPDPESPFTDLAVIDRWTDRVIETATNDDTTIGERVPIDAVLHLNFASDVRDERSPAASSAFTDTWRNQVSPSLFYEFALRGLSIEPSGGSAMTGVEQTWPGLSLADQSAPQAKAHRTLRLLSWMPHAHARAVDFSEGYAATTWDILRGLCDPTPPPPKRCLTMDEEPLGTKALWALTDCALATSWVINSRSTGLGSEAFQTEHGLHPARVVPLPAVTWDGQAPQLRALELGPGWPRLTLPQLFPGATYRPEPVPEDATGGRIERLDVKIERLLDRDVVRKALSRLDPKVAMRAMRVEAGGGLDADGLDLDGLHPFEAKVARAWQLDETALLGKLSREHGMLDGFVREKADGKSFGAAYASVAAEHTSATAAKDASLSKAATSNALGFYLAGLVWVVVDELTDAEAMFLLPEKIIDGEVLFLDGELKPVGHVHRLREAPTVPSTAAGGLRVASVSARVKPEADRRYGIRWMVILPPSRFGAGKVGTVSGEAMRAAPRASVLGPSWFLQLCGHTWDEWKQWHDREADRQNTLSVLQTSGGLGAANPGSIEGQLLQPDTNYVVKASLDWRRYPTASGPESAGGSFGESVVARFRTAAEAPADLSPYLAGHEPAGDGQPHYTHEGLRLDFRTRSVDTIWARFGKQLVVRAKADLGGGFYLQPVDSSGGDAFVEVGSPEWAWNEAMASGEVPCLSDVVHHPGSTVTTANPLSPNTSYTVTVHARPLNEGSTIGSVAAWDAALLADIDRDGAPDAAKNRVVYRFAMQTSRYEGFAHHLSVYQAATVLDLVGDGAGAVPGADQRDDAAVDAWCQGWLGGPLELPVAPEVVRLWRAAPAAVAYARPTLSFLGVLLDGPEPLLRRLADGSSRVSVQVAAGATFSTGAVLPARQVVGARGSRVFLFFSVSAGTTHVTLRFTDRGLAGTGSAAHDLVLPVGAVPAAYQE